MCPAGLSSSYEPLWWLIFYGTAVPVHVLGGRFFWRFNFIFAAFITVVLLLYCLATIGTMDFGAVSDCYAAAFISFCAGRYAAWPGATGSDAWFRGGFSGFMTALPFPVWFYIGSRLFSCLVTDSCTPLFYRCRNVYVDM